MSAWIIYDKNGLAKCETRKLEYQGDFMGSCSVNVSITSPTPIGFELGDWLEYRGERFELNYDPSVVKESSSNTYGEGFQYENIVFNSLADELTRCDFLDYVLNDNEIHYSSLPTFSFFADSITKLAERIQANLDRIYTGDKKWTVEVHPEYVSTLNVNITANNNTVWDALGFVNTMFGANFIIRGRKITIGTTGLAVGQLFSYGKGNGLYKIERNAESNQKVITRLRAYGSTRNMPADYYHNVSGGNVPNNMAVRNLMLPSFPVQTHDPYIDSKNISELGIREGTVFFDGSSELEEIYPTMEGMTAEELANAGIFVNATGALDEVEYSEGASDEGKFEEGAVIPDFTIVLKDIGFDLNDYLGTSEAVISMKDGMCGGRDFEIVKCEKDGDRYVLTCHRHYDAGLDLYFPYKDYQIYSGDKYVLLNIEMPDVYIKAASQKLLKAAEAYLAKNDYVRYGYTLSVDNIFMAKQHEEALKNGEKSIHDVIKEGDLMLFEDEDLGIDGSITISSLSIKEYSDESMIPEYSITLQNEKSVGTIERIQNQISNLAANGTGGSVNTEQVKSIIEAVGKKLFLSKTKDDRSKGTIASDKGFEVGRYKEGELGSGGIFKLDKDGNSYLEVDKALFRKIAYFVEIMIKKLSHVGGSIILSPASMKCSKVEGYETYYRCYFENEKDGKTINQEFVVGDQARSQEFNIKEGLSQNVSNQYYWRLVVGVGSNYIDLSKADCDSGSGVPLAGDDIVQLGNRNNAERQNAIILSSYGEGAPSFRQYKKIHSYSMSDAELVTEFSPESNLITGKFISKSGKDLEETFLEAKVDWDKVLEQTDKEFSMWFFPYAPSADVVPEVDWVTPELKALHEEDLFYDKSTGLAWRYTYENGSYFWEIVTDAETIKALEKASKAQETADEKIRNFGSQPIPPYDKGDRWCNATYGDLFDDDDLVCVTSKEKGEEFSIEDWRPVSYGKTSIIKNMEGEIKLLADSFELGADGKYYLSKEAGVNITTEMASLYATKTEYNTLASKVSSNSSQINATANSLSAFTEKISFNSSGDITNISKSGLVTTSNYASIFSQYKAQTGAVVQSEISAFVTESEVGDMISNIEITADKIKLEGVTTINGSFSVDTDGTTHIGGFTVEDGILSSDGDYQLKIDPKTDDPGIFITYLGKVYAAIRVSELNPKSGQIEAYGASGSVCILNGGYAKFDNASGTAGLTVDGDSINGPHLEIRKGNYFLWIGIDENGMAEISSNCWPYYDDDTTRKQGTLSWDNSRYGKFK